MRKYFQANLWIVWCLLFVLNLFLYFGLTDKSYHENSLIFSKFRIFWRIFAKILLLFFKLLYFSRNFRFLLKIHFFCEIFAFFREIFALFFRKLLVSFASERSAKKYSLCFIGSLIFLKVGCFNLFPRNNWSFDQF